MKTITSLFIILILVTFSVNSQTRLQEKKFSMSVQGGGFLPMGNASDAYNTGGNFGIGFNYKIKQNIELYAEGNYNFINYKSNGVFDGSPSIIDAGIGGRFFFGKSKYKTFIEGGVGIYDFKSPGFTYTTYVTVPHIDPETHDTTYTTQSSSATTDGSSSINFGIQAGIGEILTVANNIDIYLRSDYRMAFTTGSTTSFIGVYAGAKFRF